MTRACIAFLVLALFAGPAAAQRAERDAYDDGYKAGFKEGYAKGYREGLAEGERRGANYAPPPPPPPVVKPGPNGPIRVQSARYGSDRKGCNATHWLARRVDGQRFATVEVENKICGDPDPGQRKQLEVTYLCGDFGKQASAYEHRSLYLDCNS